MKPFSFSSLVALILIALAGYGVVSVQIEKEREHRAELRTELRRQCKENREAFARCDNGVNGKAAADCIVFWQPLIDKTCGTLESGQAELESN